MQKKKEKAPHKGNEGMKHLPIGKHEASKLRFEMKLLTKLAMIKGSPLSSLRSKDFIRVTDFTGKADFIKKALSFMAMLF